jgi:hypothetical protein
MQQPKVLLTQKLLLTKLQQFCVRRALPSLLLLHTLFLELLCWTWLKVGALLQSLCA